MVLVPATYDFVLERMSGFGLTALLTGGVKLGLSSVLRRFFGDRSIVDATNSPTESRADCRSEFTVSYDA